MINSFYFSHDFNARNDPKIKRLFMRHGVCGYGLFWAIIEDLYQNANALPTDYESIAFDLRSDCETVKSVINDFGLFVINENIFYSDSVQRRLDARSEKVEKAKKSAQARWDGKKKDEASEGIANALDNDANAMLIKGKERKGKEIKENVVVTPEQKPEVPDFVKQQQQELREQIENDKKLDIEKTKEYLLGTPEVWRLFRQWTNKTEREIFEKVLDEFLKVETSEKEGFLYPRLKQKSLFHFEKWTAKRLADKKELFKIQMVIEPVKIPTEEEKAEQKRLSREKLDAYTASLKAKKDKMDEATALIRKTKENELRQLSKVSTNLSAQSLSPYLLP